MKNRRSVGAEPHICAKNNEGDNRGGEGRTTPVITVCMSRSRKVEVCQKNKTITTGRRDDQSAISSKEHVKYEATNLFVSYVTRPLALGPQTMTVTESGTIATTKHDILQRVFSGKKTHKRVRCDTGRMHATHWFFREYCRRLLRPSRDAA